MVCHSAVFKNCAGEMNVAGDVVRTEMAATYAWALESGTGRSEGHEQEYFLVLGLRGGDDLPRSTQP